MDLLEAFKRTRQTAVPIVPISCFDPADVIARLRAQNEEVTPPVPIPLFQWDAMDGMRGLNKVAQSILAKLLKTEDKNEQAQQTANPGAALALMSDLPGEQFNEKNERVMRGSIIFALNLHRFFEDKADGSNAQVVQGIWNLRDRFKANRRTLVILGPAFSFPTEIANDVYTIDVPLPTDAELKSIIETQVKDSGLDALTPAQLEQAIDAVRGLPSAFAVEQIVSMSLTKAGLNLPDLWERKIATIEQTPGLTVDRGTETFDDAGGLEQFKSFGEKLIASDNAPLLYVRIDEIEKFFAGAGAAGGPGDNTGISQDQVAVFLTGMEDNKWNGFVALGHPGCAKSLITKGLANTATKRTGRRVLSVSLDLGATKDSLVGNSEKRIRNIFKVLKAVGGSRVCFVGTCNDAAPLPTALRRRFKRGMWMFELPSTRAEKDAIWTINLKAFGLERPATMPDDTDWTGADIRNVCEASKDLGVSLIEAQKFVVFVAKNDPQSIELLRSKADGKYLDAAREGEYRASNYRRTAGVAQASAAPATEGGRARRDEAV